MDFTAYPAIAGICYLIAEGIKALGINTKLIPVVCGGIGMILGVVGMYTVPGFPATDILAALFLGGASGLAATGAHQTVKQLSATGRRSK